MTPYVRVGIDVGCKSHRVSIGGPDGSILEEFNISHTDAGFRDFFRRVERHKQKLDLPVAVWQGTTGVRSSFLVFLTQQHAW